MASKVLIIDDDKRLVEMLNSYLSDHGFSVTSSPDAKQGITAIKSDFFDIIILDIMLPDMDGFEVCRNIRAFSHIPILMLTARGDETDRIVGLEIGADDYLPKPFNPRELLARVKAILRRNHSNASEESTVLHFGRLQIDLSAREVLLDGNPRQLTSHQFSILKVLAERAGRVQTRDQLMEKIRGETLEAFDRSIDVHISRIRAAIEDDPRHPKRIRTVRAIGYVFTPTQDES